MIGYTTLGTNDLQKSAEFYDALFELYGARRVLEDERMIGWAKSPTDPVFSVITPFDEDEATAGNGVMIALSADSAAQVELVYKRALELGASDEGAPHDRGSTMGFYGGYFRDLDGNKLVVYCLGWKAND
jgi:predicted lactoylglutathione lyase